MTTNFPINLAIIQQAAERIAPYAHQTPVMRSQALDEITEAKLFFKCENFQKVGAFKFRGACNAVFSLDKKQAKQGVTTHSSGNHGAALALAARLRGIPAYIVMPENAPAVKQTAVAGYGAHITFCEATQAAREATVAEVAAKTGATLMHPYDNYQIIAGQGTAALELLNEVEGLDLIVTPVGGGGLLSGTAIAASEMPGNTLTIGAEPKEADDAYRSLKAGKRIPLLEQNTCCDGLRTSLGIKNFVIIKEHVEAIFTASEEGIMQALKLIWERMKIIVEPSSAVALAIILENPGYFRGKSVGIVLSGGNVDITDIAHKLAVYTADAIGTA